jgi:hypothetical protein
MTRAPKEDAKKGQELVTHACNPSYSGRREQEDCGSKPAWAKNKTSSQKYST